MDMSPTDVGYKFQFVWQIRASSKMLLMFL